MMVSNTSTLTCWCNSLIVSLSSMAHQRLSVEKYFARECKIIREARHPNIVQYIGLCLAPPPMDTNPNDFSDDQSEDEFLYGKKKPRVNLRKARVLIISEFVRNFLLPFSPFNSAPCF
jgi:hypothetical protein